MNKPLCTSTWVFTLCLVLIFTLTSCEKQDANPTPALVTTCLPSKTYLVTDPTQYMLYQYDDQRRVIQKTDYVKGKESSALHYDYNAFGQVAKITITDENFNFDPSLAEKAYMIYTFEYSALGQVSKYTSNKPWLNSSYAIEETICEYDLEGNRTKTITTTDNGANISITEHTYKDGNCIQTDFNQGSSPVGPAIYQYDLSRENKLRNFSQEFELINLTGPSASKNMGVKSTLTNLNPQHNSTYNQTYEYNQNGLPTKVTDSWKNFYGSGSTIVVWEYVCQ